MDKSRSKNYVLANGNVYGQVNVQLFYKLRPVKH